MLTIEEARVCVAETAEKSGDIEFAEEVFYGFWDLRAEVQVLCREEEVS